MPAASVSIHSMRRRSTTRAGSGRSVSCDIAVTMEADQCASAAGRAAIVPRVNEQLRRRAVGAPAARSVLLTVLGEYVLPASGSAWQETLIGGLGTLGHKTHAARQALAPRLAAGRPPPQRPRRRPPGRVAPPTRPVLG